jgi:cytochrome c-type biogenesis protein CcmH/NrfF
LIPFAHLGHVLVDVPLFLGPVVLLILALTWSTRRERRRQRESGARPSA